MLMGRAVLHGARVLCLLLCARISVSQGVFCNVKDYGAAGDGKNNDTEAFVKAFQACVYKAKGGPFTVYVPPGDYSVWPLVFSGPECTNTFFNLTGSLLAPSSPADYEWVRNESYLLFSGCRNLTLHGWGSGSIDGQGQEWWDLFKKENVERPKLVIMENCNQVTVKDISLLNSPMFHLVPEGTQNIVVDGVVIMAPSDSPNTDGIDPSSSQNVVIRNCRISTGDDNVAVKPGSQNVLIENCWFGSGHGCSIGSINSTGVSDVMVNNVTFIGTEIGARIKTWQGGTGVVENVTYLNLYMEGVGLPIDINMYYCPDGGCRNQTQGVTIRSIYYRDVAGTQTSGLAGQLFCSDTVPCYDITMMDIDIESQTSGGDSHFACWRAFGRSTRVTPPSCLIGGNPSTHPHL